jgi:solute carrier family 25 (mitochondrial iron transporter), member 28/37
LDIGPAHAVYFATYEAVKHVMGGNQAGVHHPLAAGKFFFTIFPLCQDLTNLYPAMSGACATIASDALMNPFDGMSILIIIVE